MLNTAAGPLRIGPGDVEHLRFVVSV